MTKQTPQIALPSWIDLLLVHGLTLVVIALILAGGGCGTCVGNPDSCGDAAFGGDPAAPTSFNESALAEPVDEYEASTAEIECGSFTGQSNLTDVDHGRACILDALERCETAKYLLDETRPIDIRFVSFVSVEATVSGVPACQLRIHTVSNDPRRFVGAEIATCAEPAAGESLELACGIGE